MCLCMLVPLHSFVPLVTRRPPHQPLPATDGRRVSSTVGSTSLSDGEFASSSPTLELFRARSMLKHWPVPWISVSVVTWSEVAVNQVATSHLWLIMWSHNAWHKSSPRSACPACFPAATRLISGAVYKAVQSTFPCTASVTMAVIDYEFVLIERCAIRVSTTDVMFLVLDASCNISRPCHRACQSCYLFSYAM